jgi:hypothetical protein
VTISFRRWTPAFRSSSTIESRSASLTLFVRHRDLVPPGAAAVLAVDRRPEVPVRPGGRLQQDAPDLVDALGSSRGQPRTHRGGVNADRPVANGRLDGLGHHRLLGDRLSADRQVCSALQRVSAVLLDEASVVGAELGAGYRDRATALAIVQQASAAGMLGHHPNCC